MFGFLSPLALLGLALLSVPILVHLFKPKKVRRVPFSSLRWLRASQHRMSRRIRLHQVLLFLLRAGLLALLVFALAKPVLTLGKRSGATERFIILDAGRSMNYRSPNSSPPIKAGVKIARQLASHTAAADRTAVLLAGVETRALAPLATNMGPYLGNLENVSAEPADTRVTQALASIAPMIGQARGGAGVELFLITDNFAQGWSQSEIARFLAEFKTPPRVTIVDVGPTHPVNAWIADAKLIENAGTDRRVLRITLGAAGPQVQQRVVRLDNLGAGGEQPRQVELTPGRIASVEFELPPVFASENQVARIRLEPDDALPDDDVYWLNLDKTANTRVLVVEPDSTQIEDLQPGHHLRTALEVLPISNPGSLQIQRMASTEPVAAHFDAADLVILVDVPTLADSDVEALEQYVQRGGGVAVFLGPSVDPNFYNAKMFNPLRASQSLLPVRIGDLLQVSTSAGELPGLSRIEWSHPLLADLFDPTHDTLTEARFKNYYRLAVEEGVDAAVLATIGPDTPAIVEHRLGLGRVVLFNTTANDAWSDLPRRPSFVTLIDRLIHHLTPAPQRGSFALGEAVVLPLPDLAENAPVKITAPDGEVMQPTKRQVAGRSVIDLGTVSQPGVYRVEYEAITGAVHFPIVVQAQARDSTLARADEKTLQAWWQPAEVRVVRPDVTTGDLIMGESRYIFEPWLIALACLVMLAEMYFVHRVCPRMNPTVIAPTTPIIPITPAASQKEVA